MGLALVEMMMALEDRFGIVINDQEAGALRTVDDLYHLILHKLHPPGEVCLSSDTFYRIRKALVAHCGADRKAVQLDTLLESYFPSRRRKVCWMEIEAATDLALPPLGTPRWLQHIRALPLYMTVLLMLPLIFLFGPPYQENIPIVLSLFIPAFIISGCIYVCTTPLDIVLPTHTLRDFVLRVVELNYGTAHRGIPRITDEWTEERVWKELVAGIAEELHTPIEEITPATRLYDLER